MTHCFFFFSNFNTVHLNKIWWFRDKFPDSCSGGQRRFRDRAQIVSCPRSKSKCVFYRFSRCNLGLKIRFHWSKRHILGSNMLKFGFKDRVYTSGTATKKPASRDRILSSEATLACLGCFLPSQLQYISLA